MFVISLIHLHLCLNLLNSSLDSSSTDSHIMKPGRMPFLIHSAFPFMVPILSCFYNMISVRYKNNPFHVNIWAVTDLLLSVRNVEQWSVYFQRWGCDTRFCPWLSVVCLSVLDQHRWLGMCICIHEHVYIFSSSLIAGVSQSAHLWPWLCLSKHSHLQLLWRSPVNTGCCLTLTWVCLNTQSCCYLRAKGKGRCKGLGQNLKGDKNTGTVHGSIGRVTCWLRSK